MALSSILPTEPRVPYRTPKGNIFTMVRGAPLLSWDQNGAGRVCERDKGDLCILESRGRGKATRDPRDGKKEIRGSSQEQSAQSYTTN